jgi:hypothetical protein
MNKNDSNTHSNNSQNNQNQYSPRMKNKLYEILNEIFKGINILDKFSQEFIDNLLISEEENYVNKEKEIFNLI